MSDNTLSTYLNDHLAGSVAAIQLVDHLLTLDLPGDRNSFRKLRGQIEEDQKVVQELLAALGGKESPVRKAAAWLTEKLGQAKLRFDDPGDGDLRLLEALEALALGIQGKLSLWRALASVAGSIPQLQALDLDRLQVRATDQFNQVEALRLRAARRAWGR